MMMKFMFYDLYDDVFIFLLYSFLCCTKEYTKLVKKLLLFLKGNSINRDHDCYSYFIKSSNLKNKMTTHFVQAVLGELENDPNYAVPFVLYKI